jgi:polyisoprenoid-binding protein YceI
MKNLKSIVVAVVALVSFSVNAQTKKVNVEKSSIHWIGKKFSGQHDGTINLKDGALVFKGKKLAGGNFVVDMTSINTTDLKGEMKGKLDGHLKADDFFGVEKFPTAEINFKKIGDKGNGTYIVTADLTIKGITNSVTFDMIVNGDTASTKLIIDRTKYDIKYKSKNFFENMGDNFIYDDFELEVALVM